MPQHAAHRVSVSVLPCECANVQAACWYIELYMQEGSLQNTLVGPGSVTLVSRAKQGPFPSTTDWPWNLRHLHGQVYPQTGGYRGSKPLIQCSITQSGIG